MCRPGSLLQVAPIEQQVQPLQLLLRQAIAPEQQLPAWRSVPAACMPQAVTHMSCKDRLSHHMACVVPLHAVLQSLQCLQHTYGKAEQLLCLSCRETQITLQAALPMH